MRSALSIRDSSMVFVSAFTIFWRLNRREIVKKELFNELNNAFDQVIDKIKEEGVSLTDIYVSVKYDDLLLSICDDSGNVLFKGTVDGWDKFKEESDFEECITESLKKKFESLDVVTPFSVVLVNEDQEPIEDLITIDKDVIFLDDEFIKKMDKELDDFFEQLMSDVK